MNKITIIGCGPGGEDYITPAARKKAMEAECLIGSERLLELFPVNGAERICVGGDTSKTIEAIASRFESKKVAALVSGDPGVRSMARLIIAKFGMHACDVVPGVSSVQCAFAKIGLDWTDAKIITAHDKIPDGDFAAILDSPKIAILAGAAGSVRWISEMAARAGAGKGLIVCENLTLPGEKVTAMPPDELSKYNAASMTVALLVNRELLE
ncbi:MAG: precorrin-6y C5,15-methyltransferase (decarboxylating) subunit CbiE [Nitrospinae bacterium]|nr:precorrin-6y C5,15-methyltransferase (decarboxylating) subunit CbiE [Nitrospinota bacterium]